MSSDPHPPKRRRLENISAEQIAAANATLHHLLGAKQKRWTYAPYQRPAAEARTGAGSGAETGAGADVGAETRAGAGTGAAAHIVVPSAASRLREQQARSSLQAGDDGQGQARSGAPPWPSASAFRATSASTSASTSAALSASASTSRALSLAALPYPRSVTMGSDFSRPVGLPNGSGQVHTDSSNTATTPANAATLNSGRFGSDGQNGGHFGTAGLNHGYLGTAEQNADRRRSLDLRRSACPPGLPSPAATEENACSPRILKLSLPPKRPSPLAVSRAAAGAAIPQRPVVPDQPVLRPPHVHSPTVHEQTQRHSDQPLGSQQAPTWKASRIASDLLLRRLSAQESELSPVGIPSTTAAGRIALLREAVQRDDWFYQVLSQLYCLRSISPSSLPMSMQVLDPACYHYLDLLLCPNSALSPRLLHFFADFPEPIMAIYSDRNGAREVYEGRVAVVCSFLAKLPQHWKTVLEECNAALAPPLVQDLVERLHIHGPTLQTVIVRAITRLIYGMDQRLSRGRITVEQIHLHDQDAYYLRHRRRNDAQKAHAYAMLRRIHEHFSRSDNAPGYGDQIPPEVLECFFLHARPPQPVQRPTQRQHQHLQTKQGQSGQRRLLPPKNAPYRMHPTHPDTNRAALHQAHLRSPILRLADVSANQTKLYRYVMGFAKPPTLFRATSACQEISFVIGQTGIDRIPKPVSRLAPGERHQLLVAEDSVMYRLRCVVVPQGGIHSESVWAVSDNFWPEEITFALNGKSLQPRRKLHHGRYLPIDLSASVRCGENVLRVSRFRKPTSKQTRSYAVAVEIIGVTSHESITSGVRSISSEQSTLELRQSLACVAASDDQDLVVTSSSLTITLSDPYSACTIFDTPVRGASCLHRDCFDLDTFLRMCPRPAPDQPSIIDCWRCPLCRGDVRPQTLVVDGFLVDVRRQLAERDALDTRAIAVAPDGTWTIRAQERTGVRSQSLDRETENRLASPSAAEIIELD